MSNRDLTDLLREVEPDKLMEYALTISRCVRLPESDGETRAFDYIEETLASYGLTPQRHVLPSYVSIPLEAWLTYEGEEVPCTTHSMLPGADVEAELIYIPDARDIPEGEVQGKIVMTDGLAMVPVVRAAQAAGAVGVVFIAGSRDWHEMIVSPVWGSPEPKDLDAYLRLPAVTVNYAGGQRIQALSGRTGVCRMRTRVRTWWTELPVVTADIGDTSKAYLMLTGHVDSWHHGALDNASGNAAALEIGRIAQKHASALRRGMRLVFWSGHSHGRYAGSTAYCDAFYQDIHDKAFLHVNADCLGGRGASLLTQSGCMAETWALGNFAVHAVSGETLEGTRFSRSCDQSFWGTGTPSLFSSVSEQPKPETDDAASKAFSLMFGGGKSGGYGWWWHTCSDTIDKLDPEFLARDTRILLAATFKACTAPVIPFDLEAGFQELSDRVEYYAGIAGSWLDFRVLLDDIQEVKDLLSQLDMSAMPEDAANALIMRFERKLVQLLYVKGSVYGQDPAGAHALLPILEDVEHLVRETDSHKRNAWLIYLKRRLNECRNRVRELADVLQVWSGGGDTGCVSAPSPGSIRVYNTETTRSMALMVFSCDPKAVKRT